MKDAQKQAIAWKLVALAHCMKDAADEM